MLNESYEVLSPLLIMAPKCQGFTWYCWNFILVTRQYSHTPCSRDMIAHQRARFTTTSPISRNLSRLYSSFYHMLFWFTLVNACNRFPFKKWRENIVINCSTLINWIITIMALIFIDFTLTFHLMLRDPPNLSSSCGWRTNIHFSLVDQK